ncbi:protein O-mannosyl-transferase TMTC2-like [Anthonomus grandis grandis]|uniref:protein O-mannosyl-transferase TMTC2-like n=1 Tax=Anthonomus grandis grandis TaxID=2921223 RepID=UPI00216610BD|nr:protein O-mannosyl-transferase TMTC2-like [Anthonomus grandis grandis]
MKVLCENVSKMLSSRIPNLDLGVLASCTLAVVLYLNTLDSEFVYDDRRAILTNPDLLPKTPWIQLLQNDFWGTSLTDSGSHGSYRPLTVLTFRLNYLVAKFNSWGYHFVNVGLHCSATYLLIKVARLIFPRNRRNVGSVLSGILFATHPIHTEAVASIVGRADLLACNLFFLSLLAYASHVTYRDSDCCTKSCQPTSSTSRCHKKYETIATTLQKTVTSCNWPKRKGYEKVTSRTCELEYSRTNTKSKWCCLVSRLKMWYFMGVSLVLAVCAMLSKETGVTVLGVSFVYDYVYSENKRKKQKKSFMILSTALLLILAVRLQTRTPDFSAADNPTSKELSWTTRFMTFTYLPLLNFLMLIYPCDLSFDWGMDAILRVQNIRDPRVFYTLCFYGVLVLLLGFSVNTVVDKKERLREGKSFTQRNGCSICHRKSTESHSHHCRTANNNNVVLHSHPHLCLCPSTRIKLKKLTSIEALLLSLSLIIIPFLPATNLFFYVGFVMAERVLYLPSAGFCLIIGIAGAEMWKSEKTRAFFCAGFCLVTIGFCAKTVLRNRDWNSEESLYRSAIPFNPPKAYGNLGSILNSHGRVAEAKAAFRKALKYRPNMADVHYNLAVLLQSEQKLDEAIQSYQKAIHFRPSLALAYVNLGTAFIAAGKCDEAISILTQASKLDGTGLKDRREHENAKLSALLQLGTLFSEQGRLHSALAIYREAVERLPDFYPPQKLYNILGETLAKMHQDEEAEKWYRAALQAEPDHVPAHITYGKLLAKNVSRAAEAEQWFRRAQRLAPNDASVYHHYGAFLVTNRRFKEAADVYERAAELSPDDFELAVAAATAMRKAERPEDAERWYRKCVKMKPMDPRGHTNLGAMLHLNGKYKEAEHSYRIALSLQPDDETTLTNLHRLYDIMT